MIYLGSDHGGYELKENIKRWLEKWGYAYQDLGNLKLDEKDDYPDYAFKVAEAVSSENDANLPWSRRPKGIVACRSSGGVVIAANKVKGIRAVAVFDEKSAVHSRQHNDANVVALSGDWMAPALAKKIVKLFLETEFSAEERHIRRLAKIKDYELNI